MVELLTQIVEHRGSLSLVPASPYDLRLLSKLRRGPDPLRTSVSHKRLRKRERWYWAFLDYVAEGIGKDKYWLHAQLLYLAEKVRAIIDGRSGPVVLLKSTSAASMDMDDQEHAAYVSLAVDIVFSTFVDRIERKDVIANVNRMVGFDQPP